jgi:hypothetical protein
VNTLFLTSTAPSSFVDRVGWWFPDESNYDRVLDTDSDVYDPHGRLLLALRKQAVPFGYPCQKAVRRHATRVDPGRGRKLAVAGQEGFRSGTVGFMRGALSPRTQQYPRDWTELQALVRAMSAVFRTARPHEYETHLAAIAQVPATCRILGTPFTTVACNHTDTARGLTARMGCHRDAGNLPGAYGLLSVCGSFTGGLLVFPRYRVAVDLGSRDLLIADNTEVHGNTEIIGRRLSVVAFVHATNSTKPCAAQR